MSKRGKQNRPGKQGGKATILGFPAQLEGLATELYALALNGSGPWWERNEDPEKSFLEPTLRAEYFALAHKGFAKAQELVLERLLMQPRISAAEELLCRKTMDCVAWQMIQGQLYIARSLYREQKPPSLRDSNVESVRKSAAEITSADFSSFALMSDLTTFIQVGDLLAIDSESGRRSLIEVKEGETNRKIVRFLDFLGQSQCGYAVKLFRELEGEKTFKQLERTSRQYARMSHVAQVLNKGRSKDPDTGFSIVIPNEPVEERTWDIRLANIIEDSSAQGWAIDIIDGCLFIGVYRDHMRVAGSEMFRVWFDECAEAEGFPRINLLEGMRYPLALPVFLHTLPTDQKFGILFGRSVVFLGLDINGLIRLCNRNGFDARWSTRKEAGKLRGKNRQLSPWIWQNKAVLITANGQTSALGAGLFLRIFFHLMRPISALDIFSATTGANLGKTSQPM